MDKLPPELAQYALVMLGVLSPLDILEVACTCKAMFGKLFGDDYARTRIHMLCKPKTMRRLGTWRAVQRAFHAGRITSKDAAFALYSFCNRNHRAWDRAACNVAPSCNEFDRTLLFHAALERGSLVVVRLYVENDLLCKNQHLSLGTGWALPIQIAARHGHLEIVKYLAATECVKEDEMSTGYGTLMSVERHFPHYEYCHELFNTDMYVREAVAHRFRQEQFEQTLDLARRGETLPSFGYRELAAILLVNL